MNLANVEFPDDLEGCYSLSNGINVTVVGCNASAKMSSQPNPTRAQSFVTFSNPREAYTTLEVYDMSGRMIERLYQGMTSPDQDYRFEFDGSNLPNGVYLYRLNTESEVVINKFMIAR